MFKVVLVVIVLLAAGVIGIGGYYVYDMMLPASAVTVPPPTAASEPVPRPAASAPGQALEKAREVIGARDAVATEQLSEVLDETGQPATTESVAASASATPAEPVVLPPSADFQSWVTQVRISGVRGGADPRVVINGRLVRRGEVVDSRLGIIFAGVDASDKIILFQDEAGATVGRRF